MDTRWFFTVVGPLLLVMAAFRWQAAGRRLVPQAKAWLITGLVFSAAAAWLWWRI
jgi:hypothetical protein